LRVRNFPCCTRHLAWSLVIITLTAQMAARLNTIVAIAMLALYDEFDTYWQNGGYKKISDIIFAECHIFIVSNLWYIYGMITASEKWSRQKKSRHKYSSLSSSSTVQELSYSIKNHLHIKFVIVLKVFITVFISLFTLTWRWSYTPKRIVIKIFFY
jgi:hypothetical protein